MTKLLTPADVAAHLSVKPRTAAKYMRQMEHMEQPLRVTEAALSAWIAGRTVAPAETKAAMTARRRKAQTAGAPARIPRRRPA